MSIDVATGAAKLDCTDLVLPGRAPLVWERLYSTALVTRSPTALGRGWTNRYFSSLSYRDQAFTFISANGAEETFPNPDGAFASGRKLRSPAAFLELFREGNRAVVQSWQPESDEVWRYCFDQTPSGETWRLSSLDDPTGAGLDVSWDEQGHLLCIRQRVEGRELRLAHGRDGFIEAVDLHGPSGAVHRVLELEHDAAGHLIEARDAAGFPDRYDYAADGRIAREVAKDGGIFHYRYDSAGRCVLRTGLNHYNERRLRFIDNLRITEVTDSYGRRNTFQHLPSGQAVLEAGPLGETRTNAYDEHGRIIEKRDATGAATRFEYDTNGNLASVTDALGGRSAYRYNDAHQLLATVDAEGRTWQRVLDQRGLPVRIIDPQGGQWTFRHDDDGQVVEVIDPAGARCAQGFENGVLRWSTDWMGNVTRFVHDDFGRVVERTGPRGDTTRLQYDRLGRPVRVEMPDGAVMLATFDHAGNLVSLVDGEGGVTRWRYGPCLRLLQRTGPDGHAVKFIWGSEPGWLDAIVNEAGEEFRYVRDGAGRITETISFDGVHHRFRLNAEGHAIAFTDANGDTVDLVRDALHRVVSQVLPDGSCSRFTFDAAGWLIAASNDDVDVSFERDALGQVISELQDGQWVRRLLDPLGRTTSVQTSGGHRIDYERDPNGLPISIGSGGRRIEFTRGAGGEELERRLPGGARLLQQFDIAGRLTLQRLLSGYESSTHPLARERQTTALVDRCYSFTRTGSLARIVDAAWGETVFAHDPAERVVQALRARGSSEQFAYDATGNVLRSRREGRLTNDKAYSYGAGNRLLAAGTTRHEYDAEGRLLRTIEPRDDGAQATTRYHWNALGRLKAVERPDGQTVSFVYDALARRVRKSTADRTTDYLWNDHAPIQETPNDGPSSGWIMRPGTLTPLARVQGERVYSYICDPVGMPREVIDEEGALAWRCSTLTWGETDECDSMPPGVEQPFRFAGQWFDPETGLHYNRFRYYDPASGRYISQDPIGLEGGTNLYGYVRDPTTWIDPFGLGARIDDNGFFAKSNEYGRGSGSGVVTIPYQGSRSRDFTLANKEAGFASTPEGYTWHHANYDPKTGKGDMQLVKTSAHETPHSGGVSEFSKATGIKYDTAEAVQHVEDEGRLKGRPCKRSG